MNQLKDWQSILNNIIVYSIPESELINNDDIAADELRTFQQSIAKQCDVKIDDNSDLKLCRLGKIRSPPWNPKVADNLINKRNELYHSIISVKPEIRCITEILPKNALLPVDDCELQIQGFDCFTNNNKSMS